MIISDIDYIEDNVAVSVTGGSFVVTNWGPIGVQVNTEISQKAKGVIAKNEANLTFNLNFNDNVDIG